MLMIICLNVKSEMQKLINAQGQHKMFTASSICLPVKRTPMTEPNQTVYSLPEIQSLQF